MAAWTWPLRLLVSVATAALPKLEIVDAMRDWAAVAVPAWSAFMMVSSTAPEACALPLPVTRAAYDAGNTRRSMLWLPSMS